LLHALACVVQHGGSGVTLVTAAQVNALSRQTHILSAMQHGGAGARWSTNTYAVVFFAGKVAEYRALAAEWPRVRTCVRPRCWHHCRVEF
jgi:hypothetical protein